ncbi:hypothetical protein XELAEV_18024701mg [Xenopus laevis]|uniref:GIY-YIG domain-containing protein n=1 Tax=Xenopus laevis TaxID=8355 RepID=A0A974HL69_XENLA|nr:hypothetical protein XELAEV_18024701mg [Xenopus laevis]
MKTDPVQCYDSQGGILTKLKKGCYKCAGCITCRQMPSGNSFRHPHTGKEIHIKHRITCTTAHVIYIITCPCGLTYFGKTQNTLRERMGNHRSSMKRAIETGKSDLPLPKHFLLKGHGLPTLKFMSIDSVPEPNRGAVYWIRTLDTVAPRGLNKYCSFSPFLDKR